MTLTRPRDTQRRKVYDAEVAAFGESSEQLGMAEMQQLVDKWRSSKVLCRRYPRANLPVVVKDGRGRRRGAYHPMGLWPDEIRMPRFTRTKWYLLHEFAHALTYTRSGSRASHGWELCECYLYLVRVFMGRGFSEQLEREFKLRRVRYRPPRKRQMSEAQREAARQRMLAMHAERRAVAAGPPVPRTITVAVCDLKAGDRFEKSWTAIADAVQMGGEVTLDVRYSDYGTGTRSWSDPDLSLDIVRGPTPNE